MNAPNTRRHAGWYQRWLRYGHARRRLERALQELQDGAPSIGRAAELGGAHLWFGIETMGMSACERDAFAQAWPECPWPHRATVTAFPWGGFRVSCDVCGTKYPMTWADAFRYVDYHAQLETP